MEGASRSSMLQSLKKNSVPAEVRERVKAWTRERFRLPEHAPVFVSQVACSLPGCPPLETVVAFWSEGERRHHFKVFKPVTEVREDDLPPRFMKNALISADVFGCECC